MANTTISPNMGLPVPTVSVDPGPDWAENINSCLSVIDGHGHNPGSGVPVTPNGLNINIDLPFNSNNATLLRSSRYSPQGAPLSAATDIGCVYVSGVDLYYNDSLGNQVRITQSGAVSGSAGTITGLPSGTASAAYAAGTFTFQSATNTPANMAVGPIAIGRNSAASKTVTLAPNAGQASNYSWTFPASLPAATDYVTLDSSGNLSYNTATGTGNVVLSFEPSFGGDLQNNPAISINSSTVNPALDSQLIQLSVTGSALWQFGTDTSSAAVSGYSGGFIVNAVNGGVLGLAISRGGIIKMPNLAGSGSRTVTANASGELSASSDERLKAEVVHAKIPGLQEVLDLRPVCYRWRKDPANPEIGFFANEVAKVIPSAAPMGADGYYGLYDRSIIAALVRAVQELKAELDKK